MSSTGSEEVSLLMRLFVPGRICLFGEHSDWAGGYRQSHPELEKGMAIIAGTNQGLAATVRTHPAKLIVRATLEDGSTGGELELPMAPERLLDEAQAGGFFSYAAGVAYQIATHFEVGGLVIDNDETTLPVRKGLSSSAAICVLTARAFNRLYHLNLSTRGEMAFAYLGETTTPSQCGRMDQGCAYGPQPILMTFDGDRAESSPLTIPEPLYFVIADLRATKDTQHILESLNQAFPVPQEPRHHAAQAYLGRDNMRLVQAAVAALEAGDARRLGALMREAQAAFDAALQPLCPAELTAPKLHEALAYAPIQSDIYGGKGVGSQGDGAVQFIVPDPAAQDRVIERLEADLNLTCLKLTLAPTASVSMARGRPQRDAALTTTSSHPTQVRKAIITAAGHGTRMFPASRVMRKELFPLVDGNGQVKPALLVLIEEALAAGVESVAIIVQPGDAAVIQSVFAPLADSERAIIGADRSGYADYLETLGQRITFICQLQQDGFGHAVFCARDWVGDEPALLLLGDHVFASQTDRSCSAQLLAAYAACGETVVGVIPTPIETSQLYGAAVGSWVEPERLLAISRFIEKPSADAARRELQMAGLPPEYVLSFFGQYVLTPAVFDILARHVEQDIREQGEVQLTACLEALRRERGCYGGVIQGLRFDLGNPAAYRQAISQFT